MPSSLIHTSSSALCSSMPRSRGSMPGRGRLRALGARAALRHRHGSRIPPATSSGLTPPRTGVGWCPRGTPCSSSSASSCARRTQGERPAATTLDAGAYSLRVARVRASNGLGVRCASPSRRAQEQTSCSVAARHAASERRAARVCPAALAAGTPAATCRRSGMKASGRGGGGHCAASRPATQMPS